jgi:hypothetical protein
MVHEMHVETAEIWKNGRFVCVEYHARNSDGHLHRQKVTSLKEIKYLIGFFFFSL